MIIESASNKPGGKETDPQGLKPAPDRDRWRLG
jgi:hypothetical protein